MKHFFTSLFLSLSFALISTHSNAQGFSILIDSFEVQAGQEVCIPIKCKGFVQIASYQFSLERIVWHECLRFLLQFLLRNSLTWMGPPSWYLCGQT